MFRAVCDNIFLLHSTTLRDSSATILTIYKLDIRLAQVMASARSSSIGLTAGANAR
jgi:hypothetical protein